MKRFLTLALMFVTPAAMSAAQAQQYTQQAILEKDLALFLDWFPGRYDNSLQVFWEPDRGVPEDERHDRIHSIFRPVDLPAFGEHVFYVEQYGDGDPDKVYRQRIYSFMTDGEENAIRLKIYTPKKPEKLRGAYKDPGLLKGLRVRDTTSREGCDVFWRRQANQFIGYMHEGACRFNSERLGKEVVITDNLVLTEDEIWIADQAETADGDYVFGNKAGVPHKLRKIRPFECWASVLRGAKHGDSGVGNDDWEFHANGWIHDQGGALVLNTEEDQPRKIVLKMRRVEWPAGSNRARRHMPGRNMTASGSA